MTKQVWDNGEIVAPLCCCEYQDLDGERNHLVMCCCNCEALDSVCDKYLTCHPVPDETYNRMVAVVQDRCRVPGCNLLGKQGAIRISLDIAFPVIFLPCALLIATIGPIMTKLVFLAMPCVLIFVYVTWIRRGYSKSRTRLFYSWGLTSAIVTCVVYLSFVVGFREVLLWETLIILTIFATMMLLVYMIKSDTGTLEPASEAVNGGFNSSGMIPSELKGGPLYCSVCKIVKPARVGHCSLCNACIYGLDHHCVWIDACIGARNHRYFLMALVLCIVNGCYGAHLTMTTICTPEMYWGWFLWPADCRYVYVDFQNAIMYVCACYTYVCVFGLSLVLAQQVILISQNVLSRELAAASSKGSTRLFLIVTGNRLNRGVFHNWVDFLNRRCPRSHASMKLELA